MKKGPYRVDTASRRVEKQLQTMLDQLSASQPQEVVAAIEALGHNPRPHAIKKLKGAVFRIRFGDWRVVFQILEDDKVVLIVKAGRRTKVFCTPFR